MVDSQYINLKLYTRHILNINMIVCPECDDELNIPNDRMVGEIITCMDCGMAYEISNVEPVEIKHAETIAEDWGE